MAGVEHQGLRRNKAVCSEMKNWAFVHPLVNAGMRSIAEEAIRFYLGTGGLD